MTMENIIHDYEAGKITLEECNAKLKDFGLSLNPLKNVITEGGATVKENPAEINGFAMLDTGTGTLDKVTVKNGKLINASASQGDIVKIGDKCYYIGADGITLGLTR